MNLEEIRKKAKELMEDEKVANTLTHMILNLHSMESGLSEKHYPFKFKRGDVVFHKKSGEFGLIIGPLNPYPTNAAFSVEENKQSKDPRYLVICIDGNYSDPIKEVTLATKSTRENSYNSTSSTNGYYRVRYSRQSELAMTGFSNRSETLDPPNDLHEYCHNQCITLCNKDCIFHKYGFYPKEKEVDDI